MRIKSFAIARAWARFDPGSGSLNEDQSPGVGVGAGRDNLPEGWYARLDGTLVVFYGADGRVWLRIGDVTRACVSPSCVHWTRQANGMARLSLIDGDVVAASVVYFGGDPSGVPPEADFTMTDSDDFDFGEFVRRKLDNEEYLRRIFGGGIGYETDSVLTPEAIDALKALPVPARETDLGPLRHLRPDDFAAAPNPAAADRELSEFLRGLHDAPEIDPKQPAELGPPVMPLALGLTDRERDVLQLFATRSAERAAADRDSAGLELAAVAVVLGGLDCDGGSRSFEGARSALAKVAEAATSLGVDRDSVVGPAGVRVGSLGQYRLQAGWRVADRWIGESYPGD